jgi:hypothetical protein
MGYNARVLRPSRLKTLTVGALALLCLARPAYALHGGAVSIDHLRYDTKRHSLVFTISGPLTIGTLSLDSPPRLVVELPSAVLLSGMQRLEINDAVIKRARVSQYAFFPPVVRVVIETAGMKEPVLAVQQTASHMYITLAPERAQVPSVIRRSRHAKIKTPPKGPPGILGEPGLLPLPDVSPLSTKAPHGTPLAPLPNLRPLYIPAPPPYRVPNTQPGERGADNQRMSGDSERGD